MEQYKEQYNSITVDEHEYACPYDLMRRPDESELDYHKRLVYGKLVDKTLSDYDYSELSKYVYGKDLSGDVARREMYGSRYTLGLMDDALVDKIVGDADNAGIISDLDSKMMQVKRETKKLQDQRRELNKIIASQARYEHLEEVLIDAAKSLDETVGNMYDDCDPIPCGSDREAVLVLSDWHYGMTTDNVFNKYNTDICRNRVKNVIDNALKRITMNECDVLNIVLLGDFIHGAIHESARVASEELVVEQLMNVSEIIAQSVAYLSRYVSIVNVYNTYGNHGRVVAKKEDNIHMDNLERLIGWWLNQRLSSLDNVNVLWNTENECIVFNTCGHDVCCVHGDLDNVKTSPRLFYSLFKKKYGKDIECIILGDKHHRESFEELGVTSILCGALCGADEYASMKRLYSTPSQLLLIFDKDGIDAEYRLRCE